MELINWIEDWYLSNCNCDWEHTYGLEITTLDNPGWLIKVDLQDTTLEGLKIDYTIVEKSEDDWYSYKIDNNIFEGAGDPSKLGFILNKFKEVAIKKSTS